MRALQIEREHRRNKVYFLFYFDVFILKVLKSEKGKPLYSLKGENEEEEFEERKEKRV